MTLENEQQYLNVLREYRKIRNDIEDALLDGARRSTDDGLGAALHILYDLEDDLMEYEERVGKVILTKRTSRVRTDDDAELIQSLLLRLESDSDPDRQRLQARTMAMLRHDLDEYRSRRAKASLAEERKA